MSCSAQSADAVVTTPCAPALWSYGSYMHVPSKKISQISKPNNVQFLRSRLLPISSANKLYRARKRGCSLLLLPESEQTNPSNLDDLESHTGNISLCLSSSTETRNQNFVVFIGKVETTVIGDEGGDFFTVLDQLDTDTFSDGRVGLFGLDSDLEELAPISRRVCSESLPLFARDVQ